MKKYKLKNILIGLGSITAIASPIVAVVSCGSDDSDKIESPESTTQEGPEQVGTIEQPGNNPEEDISSTANIIDDSIFWKIKTLAETADLTKSGDDTTSIEEFTVQNAIDRLKELISQQPWSNDSVLSKINSFHVALSGNYQEGTLIISLSKTTISQTRGADSVLTRIDYMSVDANDIQSNSVVKFAPISMAASPGLTFIKDGEFVNADAMDDSDALSAHWLKSYVQSWENDNWRQSPWTSGYEISPHVDSVDPSNREFNSVVPTVPERVLSSILTRIKLHALDRNAVSQSGILDLDFSTLLTVDDLVLDADPALGTLTVTINNVFDTPVTFTVSGYKQITASSFDASVYPEADFDSVFNEIRDSNGYSNIFRSFLSSGMNPTFKGSQSNGYNDDATYVSITGEYGDPIPLDQITDDMVKEKAMHALLQSYLEGSSSDFTGTPGTLLDDLYDKWDDTQFTDAANAYVTDLFEKNIDIVVSHTGTDFSITITYPNLPVLNDPQGNPLPDDVYTFSILPSDSPLAAFKEAYEYDAESHFEWVFEQGMDHTSTYDLTISTDEALEKRFLEDGDITNMPQIHFKSGEGFTGSHQLEFKYRLTRSSNEGTGEDMASGDRVEVYYTISAYLYDSSTNSYTQEIMGSQFTISPLQNSGNI